MLAACVLPPRSPSGWNVRGPGVTPVSVSQGADGTLWPFHTVGYHPATGRSGVQTWATRWMSREDAVPGDRGQPETPHVVPPCVWPEEAGPKPQEVVQWLTEGGGGVGRDC